MAVFSLEKLYELYREHPRISIDSRTVEGGELFFALKGDRFDGNKFAGEALEKGAACAIIDDEQFDREGTILVPDVLKTLQHLARHHRDQFEIPVLGITGSNGKTTTKELIGAILSRQFETHVTSGNFNNHIGVPLTLLEMTDDAEVAILEMGASAQGEIAHLCEIGRPTHGLITNVGAAHIEGFGDLEGVKAAKGELFEFLSKTKGVAFLPKNEPHLGGMASGIDRIVPFSLEEGISVLGQGTLSFHIEQIHPGVLFDIQTGEGERRKIRSNLFGEHNLKNLLAAVAISWYFEVSLEYIAMAIESFQPGSHRSEWRKIGTNRFLMDCYNANPVSMRAAIDSFRRIESPHKILVLGDMLELGTTSEKEHLSILNYAGTKDWEEIWLVGEEFAVETDSEKIRQFDSIESLKKWFSEDDFNHRYFLLKGSRGIRLERLIEH